MSGHWLRRLVERDAGMNFRKEGVRDRSVAEERAELTGLGAWNLMGLRDRD
jgi:hypothetical protein